MARLANISGKDAVKAFQKAGWVIIGQVGSHMVLSKPGVRVNLSVRSTTSCPSEHFEPWSAILE